MPCLYCGKELALLKRWTGSGEFCSDTHRQQYQEEFNRLALNRLLQAKPEVPTSTTREAVESNAPEPAAPHEQEAQPEAEVEPVVVAAAVEEEPIPVEPGFLVEIPLPRIANIRAVVISETDPMQTAAPALPNCAFEAWGTQLALAGRVGLEPSTRFVDSAARPAEGRLELRDFTRSASSMQTALHAAGEAALLEAFEELMDILIFPHPPQDSPPLWQEPATEFGSVAAELGDLARVAFETTGFETESGTPIAPEAVRTNPETIVHVDVPRVAAAAEPPPVPKPELPAPVNETAGPIELPQTRDRVIPRVISVPSPVPRPSPMRDTVREREVVVRVTTPFLRQPIVSKQAQAPSQPVAEKAPEPVTKPLPVTLHALAAGRGKPVPILSSVVSSGVAVKIPRSNALPLRPVMTLEAAPPPPVDEKKADSRKLQPVRQDPRFANGKTPRPDIRILGPDKEPEKKDPEPKAAPVTETPAAETKAAEPSKPARLPAPIAAPYTASSDLGLPSLSMEASGSFWRRLPVAGKAGIAALLVVALAGAIGIAMKGTGTAASTGPRIVEADPLPTGESGWITDWGADPGVRRQRQISILRPSLNLTDYRMEFQAQIETKAVGWVFRATDPKNFYVEKLEIVKPGLEPGVALVRFAVLHGDEQPHAQFPLNLPLRLDTLYKIRLQVVGDHFTTWIQDQRIDEWTDDRIKTGGVGLYNERGESASLTGGVNVVPLVIKK